MTLGIPLTTSVDTRMSRDRKYRYELVRRWGYGAHATFVLLHPSTTPVNEDDATIAACTAFARRWKLGAMVIVNLYAMRSQTLENIDADVDPIGPENDHYLRRHILTAARHDMPLVFGWGRRATPERASWVRSFRGADRALAFGVDCGQPMHPLLAATRARPLPLRVFENGRRR